MGYSPDILFSLRQKEKPMMTKFINCIKRKQQERIQKIYMMRNMTQRKLKMRIRRNQRKRRR